jgi:hypothetical protein
MSAVALVETVGADAHLAKGTEEPRRGMRVWQAIHETFTTRRELAAVALDNIDVTFTSGILFAKFAVDAAVVLASIAGRVRVRTDADIP